MNSSLPYQPDRATNAVLALVRMAFGGKPETEPFEMMSETDWKNVYVFASRQGVLPIAYDGTTGLPERLRPPKNLLLQWGVNSSISEDRYEKQKATIEKLALLYAENSIEILILKGHGLSLYYPVPQHRECGDIDIYLFGEFERGNKLAEEAGCVVDPAVGKHSSFIFEGVMVENHRMIVDKNRNARVAFVESLLQDIASRGRLRKISVGRASVWLPSADFNAIYLLTHAASHFSGGELALRNLCDWGRFLGAEGGNIDRKAMEQILSKSRLGTLCGLMTWFCEQYLGLAPQDWPLPDEKIRRKFAETILLYRVAEAPEDEKFTNRVCRIWKTGWRYRDVLHSRFVEELIYISKMRRQKRKQKMNRGDGK